MAAHLDKLRMVIISIYLLYTDKASWWRNTLCLCKSSSAYSGFIVVQREEVETRLPSLLRLTVKTLSSVVINTVNTNEML